MGPRQKRWVSRGLDIPRGIAQQAIRWMFLQLGESWADSTRLGAVSREEANVDGRGWRNRAEREQRAEVASEEHEQVKESPNGETGVEAWGSERLTVPSGRKQDLASVSRGRGQKAVCWVGSEEAIDAARDSMERKLACGLSNDEQRGGCGTARVDNLKAA